MSKGICYLDCWWRNGTKLVPGHHSFCTLFSDYNLACNKTWQVYYITTDKYFSCYWQVLFLTHNVYVWKAFCLSFHRSVLQGNHVKKNPSIPIGHTYGPWCIMFLYGPIIPTIDIDNCKIKSPAYCVVLLFLYSIAPFLFYHFCYICICLTDEIFQSLVSEAIAVLRDLLQLHA